MKKGLIIILAAILGLLSAKTNLSAQVKIIAHRGHWNVNGQWSGNDATPQNSLAAYAEAAKIGVWGSEFDVNLTSDGRAVVCHGPKVVSLEDVQKETFANVRSQKLSNGEVVPSLDEYLALAKKCKIRPVLEIKPDYRDKKGSLPALEAVAKSLKKNKTDMSKLTIISFSLDVCAEAARMYPKTMVQYLGGNKSPHELKALGIMGLDYHYSVFDKHPEWVAEAHGLGMEVNVWTVDKKSDIKRMISLGVDQITTNYPVRVQQIIDGSLPKKALIIGAHPDDPETGCGGTMILMKRAGWDVKCVYLTRGEAGIAGKTHEEAAAIRVEEARNACAITGADYMFMSQVDGSTEITKERYEEMLKLIQSEEPDVVFTHWPIDSHRDHRVCSSLVYDCWRRTGKAFDLYYFEVMTGTQTQNFHPTDYVDITSVQEEKHKACWAHVSQDMPPLFEGWHTPMEVFRGIENRCKAAEAFIRQEDGNRIFEPLNFKNK